MLGFLWVALSTRLQSFSLFASLFAVAVVLAYLVAPSVRRSVDGLLGNIRPGLKLASARLLVIFGLSMLLTGPRVMSRMSSNSEVSRLTAEAKDAHANGQLEQAVELLNKASLEIDADDRDDARNLLREYEKELGRKQEPQVLKLLAEAKAAWAAGDAAAAKAKVDKALSFARAPSRAEAEQLLDALREDAWRAKYAASPSDLHLLLVATNKVRGKFYAEDERKTALGQIGNQLMLLDVVTNGIDGAYFSEDERRLALFQISDREALRRVATNDVTGTFFSDTVREQAKAQLRGAGAGAAGGGTPPGSAWTTLEAGAAERKQQVCPNGCRTLRDYQSWMSDLQGYYETGTNTQGNRAYTWKYGQRKDKAIVLVEEGGTILQANVIVEVTDRSPDGVTGLALVALLAEGKTASHFTAADDKKMTSWLLENSEREGAQRLFKDVWLRINAVQKNERGHFIVVWVM